MNDGLNLVSDGSLHFRSEEIFFRNLNLDIAALEHSLMTVLEVISSRIESTYKSPAKIKLLGTSPLFLAKISDFMQFDDVCIKFLHTESGSEIFITFATKLARTLLIRLLATSLIDDSQGILFSSTEKGILSFVCARLLLDLKNSLPQKMPELKLLGIYHSQDAARNDSQIAGYGTLNFSFSFAAEVYPIMVFLPHQILKKKKPQFTPTAMLMRGGHLLCPLILNLKTITIRPDLLHSMEFGDLIVFKSADHHLAQGALQGTICARWGDIAVLGQLDISDSRYRLLWGNNPFNRWQDLFMEEVESSVGVSQNCNPMAENQGSKIANLAKNIRISLSIELSRLPMTLKELCEIQEGEIIDLHRKIEDPLEMVVEGKVIGYCQPVQIDGRLGIRVLTIDGEGSENQS